MQISNTALLVSSLLATLTPAQLILPSYANKLRTIHVAPHGQPEISHLFQTLTEDAPNLPSFKAGQHSLKKQDNSTCATYGENQWTGSVDVTDERRLWFWFFDSRNDPENDPVIIWINGGPGSSSMTGLLTEMGPCWLGPGANSTVPNEWSWNKNASLLFIDQPAGTGFASVKNKNALPRSDIDGAEDFQTFLNVFFTQVFPKRAHLPIHFASESYGGHYAPTYVNHIIESRRFNSSRAFRGNITSLVTVSGLVDLSAATLGAYDLLCVSENGRGILNTTSCDAMRDFYPECYKLRTACALSNNQYECQGNYESCSNKMEIYYDRDPYDIHHICTDPECSNPLQGNITHYLNQPHVLSSLGFPKGYTYSHINLELNQAYFESGSVTRPMLSEVASCLDAHKTPDLGDIRILLMHGNDDSSCNADGTVIAYDDMPWSQQGDYRNRPWNKLPDNIDATGTWKGTKDGRLVFVRVDGAGHMVPTAKRQGSLQILEKWISGNQWRS